MPQETRKKESNGKGRGKDFVKRGRRLMVWEKKLIFLNLWKTIEKQWRKQTTNLRMGDKFNFTIDIGIDVGAEEDLK